VVGSGRLSGLRGLGRGALPLAALALAMPSAAAGAGGLTTLAGTTEHGRAVKLHADSQGRVVRGAATVLTECTGGFDPFRARLEIHRPLDRSTQDGFRDERSRTESDGQFSARYSQEIEGDYRGARRLEGTLRLTATFRRHGEKYVKCRSGAVAFEAKRLVAPGQRNR
jgi:hypothetical protein